MHLSKGDCGDITGALSGKATGWTYQQVTRWLARADFQGPRSGSGSHRVWYHRPSGKRVPMVDKGRGELLPVYVKRAARAIVEIGGCPE
jgi:hypothetical protein